MINRHSTIRAPSTTIIKLIWWVSYDYVEFHIEDFLGVVGMNKLIGILLGSFAAVIDRLAGTTVLAFALFPSVAQRLVADIAIGIEKTANTMRAIGAATAIDRPTAEVGRQLGDGDAKHLMVQDMVDTLPAVGHHFLQSDVQTLDNLTQKDTTLTEWVQECSLGIGKKLLRQQVQHLVRQYRRRKDLVVAQVGKTVEHIGIVVTVRHSSLH